MGREIKRVPLDFVFPIDGSYNDAKWDQHCAECSKADHDDCEVDTDPPKGEGWQLWQTVSDGPVTPVFETPEALIDYMNEPVPPAKRPRYAPEAYPKMPWAQGWRREVAEKFVRGAGWAPSMVYTPETGLVGGAEFVTREDKS